MLVAADYEDHDGKDEVNKIEDGKGVFKDYFTDGIRLFPRGAVDAALADFLGNFCICEPGKFHKKIIA